MPGKIIKYIPSRIGEPLTAVAISDDFILFGSISGYIGFCYYKENKVIYDEAVLYNVDQSNSVYRKGLLDHRGSEWHSTCNWR